MADVFEEQKVEMRTIDHKVIIDGLIEIVPIRYNRTDEKTGRAITDTYPISFVSVCDFIMKLKAHFPRLELAGFDKWQSSELIERLIMGGIRAESLTFAAQQQYQLYWQHRALVYNDMLVCLQSPTEIKDTPRAEREFLDLQEVIPGRKVDHKPEGSKDSADAIVIATNLAIQQAVAGAGYQIFML